MLPLELTIDYQPQTKSARTPPTSPSEHTTLCQDDDFYRYLNASGVNLLRLAKDSQRTIYGTIYSQVSDSPFTLFLVGTPRSHLVTEDALARVRLDSVDGIKPQPVTGYIALAEEPGLINRITKQETSLIGRIANQEPSITIERFGNHAKSTFYLQRQSSGVYLAHLEVSKHARGAYHG